MTLPYEGVIRSDVPGLDGHTFRLQQVIKERRGIDGYMDNLCESLGLRRYTVRLSITGDIETGTDGVIRLVYKKSPRKEPKHDRMAV